MFYLQVGTVVAGSADFYSSRIPKGQRKQTLVDELLADTEFRRCDLIYGCWNCPQNYCSVKNETGIYWAGYVHSSTFFHLGTTRRNTWKSKSPSKVDGKVSTRKKWTKEKQLGQGNHEGMVTSLGSRPLIARRHGTRTCVSHGGARWERSGTQARWLPILMAKWRVNPWNKSTFIRWTSNKFYMIFPPWSCCSVSDLRPVYTCDFRCDFWCDFAYKTRLTLPCTNVYFAKHLVDWRESYEISFEDTLLSNFS